MAKPKAHKLTGFKSIGATLYIDLACQPATTVVGIQELVPLGYNDWEKVTCLKCLKLKHVKAARRKRAA